MEGGGEGVAKGGSDVVVTGDYVQGGIPDGDTLREQELGSNRGDAEGSGGVP